MKSFRLAIVALPVVLFVVARETTPSASPGSQEAVTIRRELAAARPDVFMPLPCGKAPRGRREPGLVDP